MTKRARHAERRGGAAAVAARTSAAGAGAERGAFHQPALWVALLVVLGFAAYWNSLSNPFLLDDEISIVRNERIRDLGRVGVVLSPPRTTPVAGRPLVNLSFALNYAAGGLDVRGYHLVNIAIHVVAALLLFAIVRRTLSLPSIRTAVRQSATLIAGATALLWLLHPLQTESVDYLTQRTESMMSVFYLLTLYCCIRAAAAPRPLTWTVGAAVACVLGTACKESMVTAPVAVLLYDRVFLYPSWRQMWTGRWRLYAALAGSWVVLALLIRGGPRADSVGFAIGTSAWTYLLNQAVMITRYLNLTIWPRELVVDYGPPVSLSLANVVWPATLVAALVAVTAVALLVKPRLGSAGAWFFLLLAPTSSVVPIVTEVGAERRMYLPLAALVLLGVVGVCGAASRIAARTTSPERRRYVWAACGVLLVVVATAYAARTVARNREYASALSIATSNVQRWPHGRARFALGTELLAAGRREEGMAELWRSAETYPGARFALGTELITAGDADAGLAQLSEFIKNQPTHVNVIPAREMAGRTLMAMNRFGEARDQFTELLRAAPGFADAQAYLGDIALADRRYADAIERYTTYLQQRPESPRALDHLGRALAAAGRVRDAVPAFERAVAADPQNVDTRRNLVRALLETGQAQLAATRAEEGLAITPQDSMLHNLYGEALAASGRLDEAVAQFERAAALDPGNEDARANLMRASRTGARPRR